MLDTESLVKDFFSWITFSVSHIQAASCTWWVLSISCSSHSRSIPRTFSQPLQPIVSFQHKKCKRKSE